MALVKSILSKLEQVSAPFHCFEKFPKVFMQKLFLQMRIYCALKFANREFKQTKKKNRKYIKVTHMKHYRPKILKTLFNFQTVHLAYKHMF